MGRITLALLGLAACASPHPPASTSPPPAALASGSASPPPPAPGPRRFWLRSEHVEPVLVDRLPDGSLREITEHSLPRSELSNVDLTSPTVDRGLGLFVQRASDIHVGQPDGPVIGRVSPGAYLPVVDVREGAAKVVLPGHGQSHAFVAASALGVAPPSTEPEAAASESIDFLDIDAGLSAAPEGPTVTRTACGAAHVVERDGKNLRVAQEHDGIRVVAWLALPESRRGDHRCRRVVRSRMVVEGGRLVERAPPIPPGYLRIATDLAGRDPLEPLFHRGGALYWLVARREELLCTEWRLRPMKPRKEDAEVTWPAVRAELARPATIDTDAPFGAGGLGLSGVEERPRDQPPVPRFQQVTLVYDAAFSRGRAGVGSDIQLEGPDWRGYRPPPGSGQGIALCGNSESYTMLGATTNAVTVFAGGVRNATLAYHPEDAESWYLTRAACEADRAALLRGPLSNAHVHHGPGC